MADMIPNEGLDYWLTVMLKAGTPPATLYVGLFTGATANSTPLATAVLSTSTGVSEVTYGGYARQSIAAASWGTVASQTAWGTSGRGHQAGQVSFPAATSAYSGAAINGFFLATTLASGGVAVLYSNFDDTTAIGSLALGDIIRITPKFVLANSP